MAKAKETNTERKKYDATKSICFDFSNANDVALYKLISKMPRKATKLLGYMAREFMETFGIDENVSKEELAKIVDMYEVLKKIKTPVTTYAIPQPIPVSEKKIVAEVVEEDADMEELEEALSGFGM